jgi:unsaturated rhamnogalacturonyl hydrolase
MAAYRLSSDDRYLTYTRRWAESHSYGIPGGVTTRHADNHTTIQAYLDLYELEPSANKLTAATDTLSRMVASSKIDDWWWDDALHMAMPPFARIGRLRNDPAYWTKLYKAVLWSRGNGWVTAGHVKTLKALPTSQQNVAEYRPESSQPITYDSTADFGVGAFLLAGSELASLAR